jgi:hypothetical protein
MRFSFPKIKPMSDSAEREDFGRQRIFTRCGHLFFWVLMIFSWIFYLERTLLFDGAYFCFRIIHFGIINLEPDRWGGAYTRILPLIGLKLGCSLSTFLKIYALSYALCNYIFYIIIRHLLNKPRIALAFIIAQLIAYRYNFYYPVSEIHAAVGPLFLFLAFMYSVDFRMNLKSLLFSGLILLNLYWLSGIHALSLLVFLFFMGFYILSKPEILKRPLFIFCFLGGLVFYAMVLRAIVPGSYQASRMVGMEQIMTVIKDPYAVQGFIFFKDEYFKNYVFLSVLVLLTVFFYGYKRQWLKFLLVIFGFAGLWVIIMASNVGGDSPIVYQNYYSLFGLFFSLPFLMDVLPAFRFKYAFPFLLFIIVLSSAKIVKAGIFGREQIAYFKRTADNLRTHHERKFVIDEANIDWRKIWVDWDVCFQSLMVSSVDHPDSAISFYTTSKPNEFDSLLNDQKTFIGVDFGPLWFKADQLNNGYFNLRKTAYRKVNTNQDLMKNDSVFDKNTMLIGAEQSYYFWRADHRTIELKFFNNTNDTLFSKPGDNRKIFISYHLYNSEGKLLEWDGIRTPLELDVMPHSTIHTSVIFPAGLLRKGKYIIEFDLIQENKRWFEINKRANLILY